MFYAPIAAAGLAEAAWLFAMLFMGGGLLVIGVMGLVAMMWPSRKLAITAVVALSVFSLVCQPWYCFFPFDPKDYSDPDVASTAEDFRMVGFGWIATSVFVFFSVVLSGRKTTPIVTRDSSVST